MNKEDRKIKNIKIFKKACAFVLATTISLGTVKIATNTYPYVIDQKTNYQTVFWKLDSNGNSDHQYSFDKVDDLSSLAIYDRTYEEDNKYYQTIKTYHFNSANYSQEFIKKVVSGEITNFDKLFGRPVIITQVNTEPVSQKLASVLLIYQNKDISGMGRESARTNDFISLGFSGLVMVLYSILEKKITKDKVMVLEKER